MDLDQSQLFAASHSSGSMYIYNEEFNCAPNAPSYQLLKQVAVCSGGVKLGLFREKVSSFRMSNPDLSIRTPSKNGQSEREPSINLNLVE